MSKYECNHCNCDEACTLIHTNEDTLPPQACPWACSRCYVQAYWTKVTPEPQPIDDQWHDIPAHGFQYDEIIEYLKSLPQYPITQRCGTCKHIRFFNDNSYCEESVRDNARSSSGWCPEWKVAT